VHSGLADLGPAPVLTTLLQAWGPEPYWPGEGRSQFLGQEQEGRGSAAEARMTALPAAGREGQQRQTTAKQEGCACLLQGCRWGLGSREASGHGSPRPQICPAAEQSELYTVVREPVLQNCKYFFQRGNSKGNLTDLFSHLPVYLSIHPSIHPSIHLSKNLSFNASTSPLIYLPFHPPIHPCVCPSVYPSSFPSIYLSIQPPLHLSIQLVTQQYLFSLCSLLGVRLGMGAG
jgi:hypothetical protein